MRLHVRTDNASWLAIGCFYMQTYGARRKREGAAARRIRAAAWLNGAGAHAVGEKEPQRGGFELQHGWPEPSAQAEGGKEFEKWDTG